MTELGAVATITDCEHKTAPVCAAEHNFAWSIGTKAIRNGKIQYDQARPIDEITYKTFSARRRPVRGDLILAREAPVGDVVLVPEERRVCLGQRTVLISPKPEKLDFGYLYYVLRGAVSQDWMRFHSEGSTVKHLNVSDIYQIPLGNLPPLPEQRRIAGVLEAFDDLIETNRQLARNVDDTVFSTVDRYSARARRIPFQDVAARVTNRVSPLQFENNEAYLGLEHIGHDGVGLTGCGFSSEITSSSLRFRAGDVLFGKLRPYFRKVARPGFSGVCSAEIWVLRAKKGHAQPVLHSIVHSPGFSAAAMAGNSGTRMPRADWDHIADYEVPDLRDVLSPDRMEALDTLWEAACGLRTEAADLTRQRDELLPLLMSGKVRVADVEGVV